MTSEHRPELSVIVPILNERSILPELLANLASQNDITLELLLSDGGSTDGSMELARRLAPTLPFPLITITAEKGRGRQMNAAVEVSSGTCLLFLHADSLIEDPRALRTALDVLATRIAEKGNETVAGRFSLRFHRSVAEPSFGYYFYESKARLNRCDCIHGDQGFLLRKSYFAEIGPLDDRIPQVAETRLAEKIRSTGEWLVFPSAILTSARRFETEGLRERQTLNAILMNFAAMGWEIPFRELPHLYRSQDQSERLRLFPLLAGIDRLIAKLPTPERRRLWLETGRYVRGNAWQIPFALDCRFNFRRGLPPGEGSTPLLAIHDRCFDRLTDHPPGRLAAMLLTWFWFKLTLWDTARQKNPIKKAGPQGPTS